jgi:hypothetical protein
MQLARVSVAQTVPLIVAKIDLVADWWAALGREKETDRQTNRERDRQTDRETDRQRESASQTERDVSYLLERERS